MSGVSAPAVRAIYHDDWKFIGRDTIDKICRALDIEISDLFEISKDEGYDLNDLGESVKQGLRDLKAGRVRPLGELLHELSVSND